MSTQSIAYLTCLPISRHIDVRVTCSSRLTVRVRAWYHHNFRKTYHLCIALSFSRCRADMNCMNNLCVEGEAEFGVFLGELIPRGYG